MRFLFYIIVCLLLALPAYSVTPSAFQAQFEAAHDAYYTEKNAAKSEKLIESILTQAPSLPISNQARLLLAEIYTDTQRLSQAQAVLIEALAFHYPNQSNEHLVLQAAVYKQAGLVEKSLQHYDLAERYLTEGKTIYEQNWPTSDETGNFAVELGNVLLRKTMLSEAKQAYQQAESIWSRSYPPTDKLLTNLKQRIANIDEELNYRDSFKGKAASVSAVSNTVNPYQQHASLSGKINQGQWNLQRGYKADAIYHFTQALQEATQLYGPDAPNTLDVKGHLEQAQLLDESKNYLNTLSKQVIRWRDDTAQLTIYIHPPKDIDNWSPDYLQACQDAFKTWEAAMNHQITYRFTENKKEADVQMDWTTEHKMTRYGERMGYNEFELKGKHFLKNDIYVLVENRKLPAVNNFYNIMLHEAGHMLGLKEHSPNPVDIMAIALPASEKRLPLSQRDIASIQALYQRKPDYTNPKGYKLAGNYNAAQRKFGRPDFSITFYPIFWTSFPFSAPSFF